MAAKLDTRIKALEKRVSALEKRTQPGKGRRGWLKLAGWAKDDPLYDKAMKLGSEWRKTS
ncbi:MAG: hypothetical protein K1X78_14410 [Verrucomicrobiaceae bacterium]|nr:hypothetical protein [Verrucomicrobiaceae bacterium]